MKTMTYIKGTAAACAVAFVLSGCSMLESLPVPPAGTTAAEYYAKAVKGDAEAQHALGVCYADGSNGVAKDRQAAMKWYLKAAKQGNPNSQLSLALKYDDMKNLKEAAHWYRIAAQSGDSEAQWWLATKYEQGKGGLPKDPAAAFQWYRKSALQGDGNGMLDLAKCYHYGKGCTPSRKDAIYWYRKTAALGDGYCDLHAREALQEMGAL